MKDNNKKSELTPTQWSLYSLLKSDPSKWWTQEEICKHIKAYHYTDDERNHCVSIGDDQRAINESFVVDKIIVTDKHCFKIATLEEYKKYRAKLIRRIKNAVAQVRNWDSKYERNGQYKLFNNILEELKPENEQFHETFVPTPKLEPIDPPKEINGYKVYTRVLVDWENKVSYIVTGRKITEVFNGFGKHLTFDVLLANGDTYHLENIYHNYGYDTYKNEKIYEEFERKYIQ